jgi:hypothetical protein
MRAGLGVQAQGGILDSGVSICCARHIFSGMLGEQVSLEGFATVYIFPHPLTRPWS